MEYRRSGKPVPTATTLGDFMPQGVATSNSFDALRGPDGPLRGDRDGPSPGALGPKAPGSGRGPKVRTVKEIKEHVKKKNNQKNEPNESATRRSDDPNFQGIQGLFTESQGYERIEIVRDEPVGVVEEINPPQELIIAAVDQQKKIKIAADTGCCAHAIGPKHLPDSVKVVQREERHFSDAQGGGIEHYGESQVRLEQKDGSHISNTFQVLDVCRPLHSISMIADNDHDMLFTKECGFVVPAGVFKEILDKVKHIAEYPREGGLYVAEMIVKDPEQDSGRPPPATPKPRDSSRHSGRPTPFTRPGPSR